MTTAAAVRIGRAVRWLLLFCTVFGLATMHTLGHAGVHLDPHGHPGAVVQAADAGVAVQEAGGHCPGGHCDRGGMGWVVCLAVLGGLAVAVLLAVLLLMSVTGVVVSGRVRRCVVRVPRAPPRRRVGLAVASVAVLRV